MNIYLDVSYLLTNSLTYVGNKQNFERYLLIVDRIRVKHIGQDCINKKVEAQLGREHF